MDSRQEIGLGGAAAQVTQSFLNGQSSKVEEPVQMSFSYVQANATAHNNNQSADSGTRDGGAQRQASQPMNPRTILDPEMFVNVAQYSFGNGAVEFQVPSKSQIEAYRRGMEQGEQQQQQVEEQTAQNQVAREVSDGDGSSGEERQSVGTVAAAVFSGAPEVSGNRGAATASSSSADQQRTASAEERVQHRQTVALEA